MQVWMTRFLLETIGLFVDEDELFSCFGQQIAIFRVEALSSSCKGQGLHVIWEGKSSVNAVSTLQPPLSITLIQMKINLPFRFYVSTSFAETANLVRVS